LIQGARRERDGGKTELPNIGYEFSRKEINDLAQRLDSLSPDLSDGERALLLAIFWVAGADVSVVPAPRAQDSERTGADLKEQILKAFIPAGDNADDEFILQLQVVSDRITPPIRSNPHTTPKPNS
jgi:hypothetical protein